MKRSELKMTGDSYELTPAGWGQTYIITDDDLVCDAMRESFEDFDDDGQRGGTVHIATDNIGNFYAILEPYTGENFNENLYRKCQGPDNGNDGLCEIYGNRWEIFDDED